MSRFLPLLAVAALVVAACDQTPTEPPPADDLAVAMFGIETTGEPVVGAADATVFPSTNEINLAHVPEWGNVVYVGVAVGQVTLDFVAPRAFWECFEYRSDLAPPPNTDPNWNTDITDGLWPATCPGGAAAGNDVKVLTANEFVDVRLGFGGETDERFAWTRFYVLSLPNKDKCQAGDWEAMGFKNQGQCVRFVETGKDSR